MSISLKTTAASFSSALLSCACILAVGCQEFPQLPKDLFPAQRPAKQPASVPENQADSSAVRTVLARATDKDSKGVVRSVWIRTLGPDATEHRWRYPDLDEILARSADKRPNLASFLADRSPAVAANTAIGLARWGDPRGIKQLATAIRSPNLAMPMRCAAVESLASLAGPATVGELNDLLAQYGHASKLSKTSYIPELHAELLRGLARRADAAKDPHFAKALSSPSPEVKVEALTALGSTHGEPLPAEAADLRTNGDYRVRIAALGAMANTRHPDAEAAAKGALRDADLHVRIAAIECLGQLGGEAARAELAALMVKYESERVRTAAIAALAVAGDQQAVLAAAGDESWRVRQEVATLLAQYPHAQGAATARKLLDDSSTEVQRSTIAAMAKWPVALSGPILLSAMGKTGFNVRKIAAEQLAARWPAAAEFPVEGPAARRAAVLNALQDRFSQEFAAVATTASAPTAPAADDQRKCAEALKLLTSREVGERRRGADMLAELALRAPPTRESLDRLAELGLGESDPLVWRGILAAVGGTADEPAARLAYAASSHPSVEVRRRACEYLAAHPSKAHAGVLLASLQDENETVVCTAIRALGVIGKLDDVEPLKRLLMSRSEHICLEAAAALCRSGDPSGVPALERISYSTDPQIQLRSAQAMGATGDRAFTAALVRLLDGEASVQRAALSGLTKTVGRDMAEANGLPQNTTDRIRRWKRWYEEGGRFHTDSSGTAATDDAAPRR